MNLPIKKSSEAEVYERAFEHAQTFVKLEIESVRASYNRFFGIIGVTVVALSWLSYKDRKTMQQQVREEVSRELAKEVPEEIRRQLSTPELHAAVRQAIQDYSKTDTDTRIDQQIDSRVATAVAAQRAELDRRTAALFRDLTPNLTSAASAMALGKATQSGVPSAPSSNEGLLTTIATAKRLTQEQTNEIAKSLRSAPPGYLYIWSHGDKYSRAYAADITKAFKDGGWQVQVKVEPSFRLTNPTWIALLYTSSYAKEPTISAAISGLNRSVTKYELRGPVSTLDGVMPNHSHRDDNKALAMEIGAP